MYSHTLRSVARSSLKPLTLVTCVLVFFILAKALPSADDFKVGDQVEASVSGLEGDAYYEPCVVTAVLNNGYEVKCVNTIFFVQRGWVRRPKAAAPPPKPQPVADRDLPQPGQLPEPVKDNAAKQNPAAGEKCDFGVVPKISDKDPFSAAVAKRKLYDNYNLGVRAGGITSPLEVGVTFLTMQLGRSFKNVAYRGFRINDAAPVNNTIYNVRSSHIVCERYRDGNLRRQVESNYACFKDRDGQWACGLDGIPKITQLK